MTKNNNKLVYVGISGGVDSATTALLLKKEGYIVKGVHIICIDPTTAGCRGEQDRKDAIQVASFLDISLEVVDYIKEYKEGVFDYMVNSYKNGEVPNPDVLCNREIKFKLMLEYALTKGADYLATGHYARIINFENSFLSSSKYLANGIDLSKDQSYFLSKIHKDNIAKILLPLGDFKKEQIRDIAKSSNIPVANKKDSTGICFLEGINMQDFLKKELGENTGNVVNILDNSIIGSHKGAHFFTIGQRRGFEITKYQGKPLYIVDKDIAENILYVGDKINLLTTLVNVYPNKNISYLKDLYLNLNISKQPESLNDKNNIKLYFRYRNLGEFIPIKDIKFNLDNLDNTLNHIILKADKDFEKVPKGQFIVIYLKVGNDYLIVYSDKAI